MVVPKIFVSNPLSDQEDSNNEDDEDEEEEKSLKPDLSGVRIINQEEREAALSSNIN